MVIGRPMSNEPLRAQAAGTAPISVNCTWHQGLARPVSGCAPRLISSTYVTKYQQNSWLVVDKGGVVSNTHCYITRQLHEAPRVGTACVELQPNDSNLPADLSAYENIIAKLRTDHHNCHAS
jgi:hypothetical protein